MEDFERIREKDRVVLECIQSGQDDIQLITEATTLTNSEVNYCFRKLSELEMIEVEKPDGMVERVINGTRQVFEAPKQAGLTQKGRTYLEQTEENRGGQYQDLNHGELVEHVHSLRSEVETLNQKFEAFRKQVSKRLSEE